MSKIKVLFICHVVSYGENVQITDRSIIKKYVSLRKQVFL